MPLQGIPQWVWYGNPPRNSYSPSFTARTLDSANEASASIFVSNTNGSISKIGFNIGTVTQSGTGTLRIETVDTAGNPSGTLWSTAASGSFSFTSSEANSYQTIALSSGAIVDIGSTVAINFQISTGVIGMNTPATAFDSTFPYDVEFTNSAITKRVSAQICGIEYSDGKYRPTTKYLPIQSFSQIAITVLSSPDEIGVAFSVPFPCSLIGFGMQIDIDSNTTFLLYDQDTTTVLQTVYANSAFRGNANLGPHRFLFKTTVNLVAQGTYRLTFVPDGPAGVSIAEFVGSSTAVMSQFGDYPRFLHTQRTDSGAWTEDARVYPDISLYLNRFDDATFGTQSAGVWGF